MAKKKIICDTDVIIDYWKAANPRHLRTKEVIAKIGLENVAISVITELELLKGAINKTDQNRIIKNLESLSSLNINDAITVRTIGLIHSYSLSHNLEFPDAFIAATAIETDFELYTYNINDYKFIPGLTLFKP